MKGFFRISLGLMCLLGFCKLAISKPVTDKQASSGIDYLSQYGYLVRKDPRNGGIRSQADLVTAVRQLQRFAGLNETGTLDAATIRLMGTPRCGMPDVSPADNARRKKRYQLHGTYWEKLDLSYKIKGFTTDIPYKDQERIFKWAFDQWSAVSKINVKEVNRNTPDDKVDILINFVRGHHSDGYPFDGRGGTLAHAFYPHNNKGIAGDAHFDDDESFTTRKDYGINLDWVALHEFGHSLGLDHSSVPGSIMYPWYQGYKKDIKLTHDDIMGIQGLYGKRESGKPTTTSPPGTGPTVPTDPTKEPPVVEYCKVAKFDAWLYGNDHKTYAFVGDYYFLVNPYNSGSQSGPHKITDKWTKLRTPLSAAYKRGDGKTVFFHEGFYWKYDGTRLIEGPRLIGEYGLPKELSGMNGAFIWGRNSKTYMFKGNQYWRYNEQYRSMDPGYPKDMSIWKKIPKDIDAVMKWSNGKTYYFKGQNYYKLDDYSIQSEAGYPKSVALKWMKCKLEDIKLPTAKMPTENPTIASKNATEPDVDARGSSTAVFPSLVMLTFGVLTAGRLL